MIIFVKITILLRAIAPWHCCKPPSAWQEQWRPPCSLSWITKMGSSGTHPQRSHRKRRCRRVQLCEGCRARNWSFVLDNPPPLLPMVAVGEAHPEHDGPAHGTRVPRIRVRSVEWDILSTAVLTCYCMLLLRCRRRGHGVWRQVRRQSAGGGVA